MRSTRPQHYSCARAHPRHHSSAVKSAGHPRSLLIAKTSERPGVLKKPRVVAQRLHSCDVEWYVPEADGSPVHMCSLQVPGQGCGCVHDCLGDEN